MGLHIDKVLIVGITPYFLEKGNFWFEENLQKMLQARKTQSFFEDNIIFLEKGQKCNFSQLLRKLDEMGYERVLTIQEPGELSQRGGVLDVFPTNADRAYRLEFLGSQIEQILQLPIKIKDEKSSKEILKKKLRSQKLFSDLRGLKENDYLVHLDHGVGRFTGVNEISHLSQLFKYYVLEYAQGDKLYVPVGLERKLSRYVGFTKPKISRLSASTWLNTKRKVKAETEKLAKELLEIYAKREISVRSPYPNDADLDSQIRSSFPYEETPDQVQTMEDIRKDLEESEVPMDRIVCGDVGFGKTEIALRSMIKVLNMGKQAAMICPTTILAFQHYKNFEKRLQELPIKLELLTRLQSRQKQGKIIENLKTGKTDIVVGTHRLLSSDIDFKNLGILVIDDEQRFGVKQKEKMKKMRPSLDVLSLSATPIPRTLYLSLSSLKNMSTIQTPPSHRLPIKTVVAKWSAKIIKKAVEQEISRKGQIYYLHNKIENIEAVRRFLQNLFPQAKLAIAHGRLNEKELIRIMNDFRDGKIDVLVSTTIIENGIDLPNVNTLIVADAARLGLAEAYQIRGRVGRSDIQAFSYFLYPPNFSNRKLRRASDTNVSDLVYPHKFCEAKFERAKERLKALKEAEELGSGYKIALRDLEIRGAGNILGKEQSGSINQVGLNLYCQMLSEAVEKMKGQSF